MGDKSKFAPIQNAKKAAASWTVRFAKAIFLILLGAVFARSGWFEFGVETPGQVVLTLAEASAKSAPIINNISEFCSDAGYTIASKLRELREYAAERKEDRWED